jgi:hypothetical protein
MHLAHPRHPDLKGLGRAFLMLALLVVAALTLTQCNMVGDNVTGVNVGLFKSTACLTQCRDTYQDDVRAESTLHNLNEAACNGDAACLAAEQARHEAALQSIRDKRDNCYNNCHDQGGGATGP